MLPISFKNFIPKIFQDNMNDSMQALVDKADVHIKEWEESIKELAFIKIAERCPFHFLNELGNYLNAGFKPYDSEIIKRKKIVEAIRSHKKRGTWENDAKIKIDTITSYDAEIFRAIDSDDAIELAKENNDPDYYWMTEQANDGSDDNLGVWEVGDWTEYVIGGIIYIDCHKNIHVSTLTPEEIIQIVLELANDIIPAYYRIYLGYVDINNSFAKYSGGQIH